MSWFISVITTSSLTDWLLAVFAGATAWFAWQSTKMNQGMHGLTAALESHSTYMLLIEAKRGLRPGAAENQPIRTVWWDPTREKAHFYGEKPGVIKRHHDEISLEEIRLYIPKFFRQGKKTL